MNKKKSKTSDILENAINKSKIDKVTIKDFIVSMESGGFGLIIMIFSIPLIIPILPPPLPSILAVPLLIFAIQMICGLKSPKLPKILSDLSIKRVTLALAVEKTSPYIKKIEKLLRPRIIFLTEGIFEKILGCFVLLFTIAILIPLPFTNLIPASGIAVISFGLIGRDGLMIIIGIIIGIIGVIITIITIFIGIETIEIIKNYITLVLNKLFS